MHIPYVVCAIFGHVFFVYVSFFVWQNSLCILPPSSIIYKLWSPPDIYIYIYILYLGRVGIRSNVR